MVQKCPSINAAEREQEDFWQSVFHGDWDAHRIGWTIAGAAAAVTLIISLTTVMGHALHFHKPAQQRQIIRILLFAPVYAVVSFLGYVYFRAYQYFEVSETVYEAIAVAAFLMLCLAYLADGDVVQERARFAAKDKTKLPIPLCCFRYRPSKAYFLYILKFSVVQYVVIRPLLSIAGIVTEAFGLYCNETYSYKYAHVYITAVDFASISVALMALIVLYDLIKKDLSGRRPLAKFMTIKLAIFFCFYQSFVFSILQDHGVIRASQYWTSTNVADGLNSLAVTLEMVLVAAFQAWAFHWGEYREHGKQLRREEEEMEALQQEKLREGGDDGSDPQTQTPRRRRRGRFTNPLYAIWLALWLGDLFAELWYSMRFAWDRMRGKEYTQADYRYALDTARAQNAESAAANGRHAPDSEEYDHFAASSASPRLGDATIGRTRTGLTTTSAASAGTRLGQDKSAGLDFQHIFAAAAARPAGADGDEGDVRGSESRAAPSSFGTPAEYSPRQQHQQPLWGNQQQYQQRQPQYQYEDSAAGMYDMQDMRRGGPTLAGYGPYDARGYAPQQQQQQHQPQPSAGAWSGRFAGSSAASTPISTAAFPQPPSSAARWAEGDDTLVGRGYDDGRYQRIPYRATEPPGAADAHLYNAAQPYSQRQQQQGLSSGYPQDDAAQSEADKRMSVLSWEPQAM